MKGRKREAVMIRVSGPRQDQKAQVDNVRLMLHAQGKWVPDDDWFRVVVPRAGVGGDEEFNRLMGLVERGVYSCINVERQDRFGTDDVGEFFAMMKRLRDHGAGLWDLTERAELSGVDDGTLMRAFLGGVKSKKEREDIGSRSMRTKVSLFREQDSWPSGPHPFGYAKRCYSADGRLIWEWQPAGRVGRKVLGQVYHADAQGNLTAGQGGVPVPRKNKGARERTVLVPSSNPAFVRAVTLIFDLFVRVGLSRRQVTRRLNDEGLRLYDKPFTVPDVTMILSNPAYAGDTVYGRQLSARHWTFDARGLPLAVEGNRELYGDVKPNAKGRRFRRRKPSECLVKKDTHEPLVDRKTFDAAQARLAREKDRRCFAPRNAAHYLKGIFRCGKCGQELIGRTERNRTTGEPHHFYVCSTYMSGQANGHPVSCGHHRISHDGGEAMLLGKVREMGLSFEQAASAGARANLEERLARLGVEDERSTEQWHRWFAEGIDALADYLAETYPGMGEYPAVQKVRKLGMYFYCGDLDGEPNGHRPFKALPVDVGAVRRAVREAEEGAAAEAREKVAELTAEHKRLTRNWARATDEMQVVLKEEIERVETERREWEARTVPLSQRVEALCAAEAEREVERQKLLAEYPGLEGREKGEALKRLFKSVTLFWEGTWHPASAKPTRPRKTDRPGRWSYALKTDETEWAFTPAVETELGGSC
jgi:DNA invertase Pin-like site-specific DNA recombinase/predicted RNA-binding Zn-ribbon protein involved in translation (DUF1610 family)